MESEYLQDQIHSIPGFHLRLRETQMLVHVPDLGRLHDISDDEELSSELISDCDELIELT
jgi:hypothetical protein